MSHEVVPCTVEVYRLDCPESLTSLVFQRPVVSYLYRAGRPVRKKHFLKRFQFHTKFIKLL